MSSQPRALMPMEFDPGRTAIMRSVFEPAGIELVVATCKTPSELVAAAREVDGSFEGPVHFTREVLAELPRLKTLCALGIGCDRFDIDAATDLGITVVNIPRIFHREVATHAMALLLSLIRQTNRLDSAIKAWSAAPDSPVWPRSAEMMPTQHVYGQTLGLVSFGNIARVVAKMAQGFELRVIAYDPYVRPEVAAELGVELVSLDRLFSESDFVSIHSPLTAETRHFVGEAQLRAMKPTALLINTGRGPVVDEAALTRALREGWIAGAGLDVLEQEPPKADNPLLRMPNVIVTPHIASASNKGNVERARFIAEQMTRVLNGQWPSEGLVNKGVKPRFPLA
jgi:D-3-phosphoglycerate dehydrogenase / 2-oxoglutarate reductase